MSDRFRELLEDLIQRRQSLREFDMYDEAGDEYAEVLGREMRSSLDTIIEALTAAEERDLIRTTAAKFEETATAIMATQAQELATLQAKLEAAEAAMDNATSRLCGDYCGATCNDMHDIIREALAKLRGSEVKP